MRPTPARQFQFVIFTCPYAAYFAAPVDVHVCERCLRAFPGGIDDVKPGADYGPALIADREAAALGCSSVLWLDAIERSYIEECGVMNVFFVLGDALVPRRSAAPSCPGSPAKASAPSPATAACASSSAGCRSTS